MNTKKRNHRVWDNKKITMIECTTRISRGDLTLPFLGFILLGAVSIAALTGVAQYNIITNKINVALQEGQSAATSFIRENLNDGALIATISPSTQNILNNARLNAIETAKISLGPKIREQLLLRNSSTNIFDNAGSFVRADGNGKVEIQIAVDAQILSNIPVRYQRKTKILALKPSEALSHCAELNCTEACGECGSCDTCTGKCIPRFNVPDGSGGFKEPDTKSLNGYTCKENSEENICSTVGWETITENGIEGCKLNNCKFLPNYTAWNIIGEPLSGTAKIYRKGILISTDRNFRATNTQYSYNGKRYLRSQEFPSDNQDDPGKKNYAVCEVVFGRRIFISSQTFTGNLINEASNYGIVTSNPVTAANGICTSLASGAGLPGSWSALLGYYNTNRSARIAAPIGRAYFTPKENSQDEYLTISKEVFGIHTIWEGVLRPINVDQFGNEIPVGQTWFVWTGFKGFYSNNRTTLTGNPAPPAGLMPAPNNRYFVSGDLGPNSWIVNSSGTCADWGTNNTNQGAWYGISINSSSISSPNALYSAIITGAWGDASDLASSCSHRNHLYCVENTDSNLP